MAEIRASAGGPRPSTGPSCAAGVDARRNVPDCQPDVGANSREDRCSTARGTSSSQALITDFLIGAYADIGVRVVSKASYAACGRTGRPHAQVVARALLSHTTPNTAFRGFGTPQASWAVESQLTEAARMLGIDPIEIRRRNLARKGRAVHPERHARRRRLARGARRAPQRPSLARAPSAQSRPRDGTRPEELVDRLGVAGDRSPALRWQRHRALATSDMGQGARTVLAQIAGAGAGCLSGSGDDRHGRYRPRSVRFLDIGEPFDRLHGERRRQSVRPYQKPDSEPWRPCVQSRRVDRRGRSGFGHVWETAAGHLLRC